MNTFKDAQNNYDWKKTPSNGWILHFGEVVVGRVEFSTLIPKGSNEKYLMTLLLPYHKNIHERMIGNRNGQERMESEEDAKNKLLNCALYWFQLALKKI